MSPGCRPIWRLNGAAPSKLIQATSGVQLQVPTGVSAWAACPSHHAAPAVFKASTIPWVLWGSPISSSGVRMGEGTLLLTGSPGQVRTTQGITGLPISRLEASMLKMPSQQHPIRFCAGPRGWGSRKATCSSAGHSFPSHPTPAAKSLTGRRPTHGALFASHAFPSQLGRG